jgi:PKD repeat protein
MRSTKLRKKAAGMIYLTILVVSTYFLLLLPVSGWADTVNLNLSGGTANSYATYSATSNQWQLKVDTSGSTPVYTETRSDMASGTFSQTQVIDTSTDPVITLTYDTTPTGTRVYARSGTFISQVYGFGGLLSRWTNTSSMPNIPSASIGDTILFRSGWTPTPDSSWTDWVWAGYTTSNGGNLYPYIGNSLYVQYQVQWGVSYCLTCPFTDTPTFGNMVFYQYAFVTQTGFVTAPSNPSVNGATINGVAITQSTPANTSIRWAISNDSGSTWKVYSNGGFSTIPSSSIASAGNTADEIQQIPVSSWQSLGFSPVVFGFTLSSTDGSASPSVSAISVTTSVPQISATLSCPSSLYETQSGTCTVTASTPLGTLAYSWSGSSGIHITGSGSSVQVYFSSAGTKTVQVAVSLAEMSSDYVIPSATLMVTAPSITAALSCPSSLHKTQNGTCTVTASSLLGTLTYAWSGSTGAHISPNGNTATISFSSAGTKTVQVAVSLAEIPDDVVTATATITVSAPLITASLSCPDSLYQSQAGNCSVTASTDFGTLTYSWSGSSGIHVNPNGNMAAVYFDSAGLQTVQVAVSLAEIPDDIVTSSATITVSSPNISADLSCPSSLYKTLSGTCTVTASAPMGTLAYSWSTSSDGNLIASGSTAQVSFSSTGPKTVQVIVSLAEIPNDTLTKSTTINVSVPQITADISCPLSLYKTQAGNCSVIASTDYGTLAYSWSGSSGLHITASGTNGQIYSDATGTATVQVTVSSAEIPNDSLIRSTNIKIAVPAAPKITISGPRAVRLGDSATYTTGITCVDGMTCSSKFVIGSDVYESSTIDVQFSKVGKYDVTAQAWVVEVPESRSQSTLNVTVSEVPKPFVSLDAPKIVEVGVPFTLKANLSARYGTPVGYWTLPDGSRGDGTTLTYTATSKTDNLKFGFTAYILGYPYTTKTVLTPAIKVDSYEMPQFNIRSFQKLNDKPYAPYSVSFGVTGDMAKVTEYGVTLSHIWDFGDGTTTQGASPKSVTHVYVNPGTYTLTLTVTDSRGNSCQDSLTLTVLGTPPLVVDSFKVSSSNKWERVPLTVSVKPVVTGGHPKYDQIKEYEWTVNGSPVKGSGTLSVTFTGAGDYTIGLTVIAISGKTASNTYALTVNPNQLPQCTLTYTDYPKYKYTMIVASCTDPDGRIVGYNWDLGEGTTSKATRVFARYQTSGTYNVTLTVKDDLNGQAVFTQAVAVSR